MFHWSMMLINQDSEWELILCLIIFHSFNVIVVIVAFQKSMLAIFRMKFFFKRQCVLFAFENLFIYLFNAITHTAVVSFGI